MFFSHILPSKIPFVLKLSLVGNSSGMELGWSTFDIQKNFELSTEFLQVCPLSSLRVS